MCELREKVSVMTGLSVKEVDTQFEGLIDEHKFFSILRLTMGDIIRKHLKLDIRENLLLEYDELKKIDSNVCELEIYAHEEIDYSQPKFIEIFCDYYIDVQLFNYNNFFEEIVVCEENFWFFQKMGERIFDNKRHFCKRTIPQFIYRDFIVKYLNPVDYS